MSNAQPPGSRQDFTTKIARLIDGSNMSQATIARLLGYRNANMITMFKSGQTRMPVQKVVVFAKAVGCDPGQLLQHWFDTYMPGMWSQVSHYANGRIAPP